MIVHIEILFSNAMICLKGIFQMQISLFSHRKESGILPIQLFFIELTQKCILIHTCTHTCTHTRTHKYTNAQAFF